MSDPESATPADKGRGIIMAGSGVKLGLLGRILSFSFRGEPKPCMVSTGSTLIQIPGLGIELWAKRAKKGQRKKETGANPDKKCCLERLLNSRGQLDSYVRLQPQAKFQPYRPAPPELMLQTTGPHLLAKNRFKTPFVFRRNPNKSFEPYI